MSDKQPPFCHLHLHTCYSLLDSTCKVGAIMEKARELGQEYVAMTDHGVMYGAVEFYEKAIKAGIKPVIGCEVYVARNGMEDRSGGQKDNMHLVLLAETNEGYQNLIRLVSTAHLEGYYYKPRIDKELLRKNAKGLIGLSACLGGEVTEAAAEGQLERSVELAEEYRAILGENNFFIEIQDHGIKEQRIANDILFEVSKRTGIPLVATNDVHYLSRKDCEAHDVLICLQQQAKLTDEKRMRYDGDQFYMKSGAEMLALFPDHPEAISNTVEIARRCNVEFFFPEKAEDLHFPVFPLPSDFEGDDKAYLIHLGKTGLEKLYGIVNLDDPQDGREQEIRDRFYYEVGVIEKTNYVNYFLVVQDFIRWAKDHGIPVGPGRGSGAGSLLAYSLGITTVDPLAYSLIFERFLNPDRVSPPDFDIDFCPTRRADVIGYVREKYGRDCVAQIVTFGTLGAKTLMRDIGRVLDLPLADCDRVAKLIPDMTKNLQTAQADSPDFKRACESDPAAMRIMQYAPSLEGLPRHTGMHAAGVVIGEKPLIEILPLTVERKENQVVVQFEKGPTEQIGLLKMDFLGLKNLTTIQEAVEMIGRNHGVKIDPEDLPLKDKPTFELLARGDTVGIFQLESGGMRDTLRQMGPDCIEDVIAILALYRPGPMQFIPQYIKRKHGQEKVHYDHELLEPILKETYGIIVYQEQIQQAAQKLAGFSLGQGDILRRAMGKKKPEEMAKQRGKFVEGCQKTNNIPARLAEQIFANIEKFAQYGFNKSHSTAYGFVTYQTAYLKAHYPVEFMAALLSGEMSNTDKLPVFIAEAREMGLEVLPPDVNESRVRFNAANGKIRFGMAAVKGVGEAVVDAIVKEREASGPFKGLMEFCSRMGSQVNRKALESLIRAGAFDFCGVDRARLYAGIETAISRAAETARDRASGQTSMFDLLDAGSGTAEADDSELPAVEPWTESEMLAAEKELIGFYISGHPVALHEWTLNHMALQRVAQLADLPPGTPVRVGGMVTELRRMFTKRDQKPMAAFRLEGLEGSINCIVFPEPYDGYGTQLHDDAVVMIGGTLAGDRTNGNDLQIQVAEIYPLARAAETFADYLSLHFTEVMLDEDRLENVKRVVRGYPGQTEVRVCLTHDSGAKIFMDSDPRFKVGLSDELVRSLEKELGESAVYVQAKEGALLHPGRNERRFGPRA